MVRESGTMNAASTGVGKGNDGNAAMQRDLAIALARAEEAEQYAQKMELVSRISLLLSDQLNLQDILDLTAREVVRLFEADHVGIMLFEGRRPDGLWGTVVAEYPGVRAVGIRMPLSDSAIMNEFYRTGKPVCITNVADHPLTVGVEDHFKQLGIVSMMIFPLISQDRIIGSIGLDCYQMRTFSEREQELLLSVSSAVTAAVQHARLFAAEQEARKTADTLREVARVLSSSFDPNEVLALILRELQKVVHYHSASIMLLEQRMLRMAAFLGLDNVHTKAAHDAFTPEERSAGWKVVQTGQPLVIPDTRQSPEWSTMPHSSHIRSWLGVPLIFKGRVLGVLNINGHAVDCFTPHDSEVALAFANQAAVALENARLYQESVTRFEQELAIARQIQLNLFPRSLPTVAGVTLAARCDPARETGGDFYDVFTIHERRLAIMVGDASGKSISGAMLMMIARATARSEATDDENPATVMRETNRGVARDTPPNAFVAFCYATIDPHRRVMVLANAGQLSPMRRRRDGYIEYLHVPYPTLPLGVVPDTPYQEIDVALAPGDTLLFYTDGIIEAHNAAGELFGFERLEMLLKMYGDLPPQTFVSRVMTAINVFVGTMPPHDDMTLVMVRLDA